MYEINGMSLRKYCLEKGINYFSVYQRMIDKCETPEEAIKNIKPIKKYDGKSRYHICKIQRISYHKFCRLMRNGLSYDEAMAKIKKKLLVIDDSM